MTDALNTLPPWIRETKEPFVLSDGTTGMGEGALTAAASLKIRTGGYTPLLGTALPTRFGLVEGEKFPRTYHLNLRDADAALIFCYDPRSDYTTQLINEAKSRHRDFRIILSGTDLSDAARWVKELKPRGRPVRTLLFVGTASPKTDTATKWVTEVLTEIGWVKP